MKSNSQDPTPPCKHASSALMGSTAAHTWLCQIPPCRTPAVVSTASRVEPIPRFQRMVGARRAAEEGREGREQLGAQLPANTRAHSISPRPSDTTSHSPASAHTRTSPPCHLRYPPLSLLCCAPLFALWGTEDAAGFYCLHD